jgi:AraC-like DNA-binding protein
MSPGSLLLGNPKQYFECGHAHGEGDRCISFRYAPENFEQLAEEAGVRATQSRFTLGRLPPLPALSPVIGRACAALLHADAPSWEELAIQLAVKTMRVGADTTPARADVSRDSMARVTRIVRAIERRSDAPLSVDVLARRAELSRYHFLRTFERVTGVTPHQYLLRTRLREAAARLLTEEAKVLDIAFDSGFGDVSNFNRAFRAEFGAAPRVFRAG